MIFFSVGITFTVHPSNIVEVNEVVTLQCALDPNPTPPVVVYFSYDLGEILCLLEPYNGVCKNTPSSCVTRYNGSCSNETLFSMQVNVPWTWNGISLSCKSFFFQKVTLSTSQWQVRVSEYFFWNWKLGLWLLSSWYILCGFNHMGARMRQSNIRY